MCFAFSYPSQEAIRYRSKNTTVLDIESSFLETLRYAAAFNRIAERHQKHKLRPLSVVLSNRVRLLSFFFDSIVWRTPYKNDVPQTTTSRAGHTHCFLPAWSRVEG